MKANNRRRFPFLLLPLLLVAALLAGSTAAVAFPWLGVALDVAGIVLKSPPPTSASLKQQTSRRLATLSNSVNGARVNGAEPGVWTHDWDAAAEAAKRTGMPVFALFTGSDWCPWCKVLERQVFEKKEWRVWARKNDL